FRVDTSMSRRRAGWAGIAVRRSLAVIRDAPVLDEGERPRDQPRLKNRGGPTTIRANRRIQPRTERESGNAAAPRVQAQRQAPSPARIPPGPSLRLGVRAPSLRDEVRRPAPIS